MRKTEHSIRENLERIANNLVSINWELKTTNFYLSNLDNMATSLRKYNIEEPFRHKEIKDGLSKICQNNYAANLRIDEVIKTLKEVFPDDKDLEGRRET